MTHMDMDLLQSLLDASEHLDWDQSSVAKEADSCKQEQAHGVKLEPEAEGSVPPASTNFVPGDMSSKMADPVPTTQDVEKMPFVLNELTLHGEEEAAKAKAKAEEEAAKAKAMAEGEAAKAKAAEEEAAKAKAKAAEEAAKAKAAGQEAATWSRSTSEGSTEWGTEPTSAATTRDTLPELEFAVGENSFREADLMKKQCLDQMWTEEQQNTRAKVEAALERTENASMVEQHTQRQASPQGAPADDCVYHGLLSGLGIIWATLIDEVMGGNTDDGPRGAATVDKYDQDTIAFEAKNSEVFDSWMNYTDIGTRW